MEITTPAVTPAGGTSTCFGCKIRHKLQWDAEQSKMTVERCTCKQHRTDGIQATEPDRLTMVISMDKVFRNVPTFHIEDGESVAYVDRTDPTRIVFEFDCSSIDTETAGRLIDWLTEALPLETKDKRPRSFQTGETSCYGCEGSPSGSNIPCAVCGRGSSETKPLGWCVRSNQHHMNAHPKADDCIDWVDRSGSTLE
jgi:hypothetical protein